MQNRPVIPPCGCGGENKPLHELKLLVAALERKEKEPVVGLPFGNLTLRDIQQNAERVARWMAEEEEKQAKEQENK